MLIGKRFDTISDINKATTKQLKALPIESFPEMLQIINVGISASLAKNSTLKEFNSIFMQPYNFVLNKIINLLISRYSQIIIIYI